MNIYLQMMILGMFLKYCYALTRIQQKKKMKKWSGTYCVKETQMLPGPLIFPPLNINVDVLSVLDHSQFKI